jgi:putative oxidoreductase
VTPLASAAITGTMITAIRKAHASNGPWVTNGGYEYNLVLLAAVFGVTERENGAAWALAQLAAGAAGSFLATSPALTDTEAPAPQEGHADTPGDPATQDAEPRFHRESEGEALQPTSTTSADEAGVGRS